MASSSLPSLQVYPILSELMSHYNLTFESAEARGSSIQDCYTDEATSKDDLGERSGSRSCGSLKLRGDVVVTQ